MSCPLVVKVNQVRNIIFHSIKFCELSMLEFHMPSRCWDLTVLSLACFESYELDFPVMAVNLLSGVFFRYCFWRTYVLVGNVATIVQIWGSCHNPGEAHTGKHWGFWGHDLFEAYKMSVLRSSSGECWCTNAKTWNFNVWTTNVQKWLTSSLKFTLSEAQVPGFRYGSQIMTYTTVKLWWSIMFNVKVHSKGID